MFDASPVRGLRQVIDVSGDGVETPPHGSGPNIDQARALAASRNVTVNGLAIINELPFLDRWYGRHMITGPGAFVIIAANFRDFRQAIRRKLLREIRGLPNMAMADRVPARGRSPSAATEYIQLKVAFLPPCL